MYCVVGGGRVGLTVAFAIARKENVIVIDKDYEKVMKINRSIFPFYDESYKIVTREIFSLSILQV